MLGISDGSCVSMVVCVELGPKEPLLGPGVIGVGASVLTLGSSDVAKDTVDTRDWLSA